jgi:hypothetical protein
MPDIKQTESEESLDKTAHQQVPSDDSTSDIFRDARDEEPVPESPKPQGTYIVLYLMKVLLFFS